MRIKVALIIATLLTIGQSAGATEEPKRNTSAIEYVMRADGVSRAEAIRRLDAQPDQLRTAERLTKELGGRASIEAGELVVNVSDSAAAATVRAAGARPRLVPTADLPPAPVESATATAVQNVSPGLTQVNGTEPCTAGFAARDEFGFDYMFTALHCVKQVVPVVNGIPMGDVAKFDTSQDIALVRNLAPFALQLGPHVFDHATGKFVTMMGDLVLVPGAVVCKEGVRTKHQCGRVTKINQTVNTGKHGIVTNLVKTDICVKGGDSGGPLYVTSSFAGFGFATGITESSQLFHSNGTPWHSGEQFCGTQLTPPRPDVSYFIPIRPHLAGFGMTPITG